MTRYNRLFGEEKLRAMQAEPCLADKNCRRKAAGIGRKKSDSSEQNWRLRDGVPAKRIGD